MAGECISILSLHLHTGPRYWTQVSRLASQAPLPAKLSHCVTWLWKGLRMPFHQGLLSVPFFYLLKENITILIGALNSNHFYTSTPWHVSCHSGNLEVSSSRLLWLCCIFFWCWVSFDRLTGFFVEICSDPWAICKLGFWDIWYWVVGEAVSLLVPSFAGKKLLHLMWLTCYFCCCCFAFGVISEITVMTIQSFPA